MRLRFTNTDSSGRAVTDRFAVTVDGDRYSYEVASTGTVNVAKPVADHLLESDGYQVEPYSTPLMAEPDTPDDLPVEANTPDDLPVEADTPDSDNADESDE